MWSNCHWSQNGWDKRVREMKKWLRRQAYARKCSKAWNPVTAQLIYSSTPFAYIIHIHSLPGTSPPPISNWSATTLISRRSLRWYVQRNFLRSNILLMCTWLPLISHSLTALLPWCQPIHRTKPTQLARKRPANLSDTYWSHGNNISGFTLHLLNVPILNRQNKSLSTSLFGLITPSLLVSPPLLSYDMMNGIQHKSDIEAPAGGRCESEENGRKITNSVDEAETSLPTLL